MSDSLWPHGPQHTRLPCSSPTPRACSNSCPLSQWCHPTISSSVVPFSSCLQSFPASGSFAMSPFFTSGGQSIGVSASASVFPGNIQDWFPLGLTGLISLQSFATPWSWQINSHIFSSSLEGTKVRKNTSHLGSPEMLPLVCLPKTMKQPVIFFTSKMGLLRSSGELKFGTCNCNETCIDLV